MESKRSKGELKKAWREQERQKLVASIPLPHKPEVYITWIETQNLLKVSRFIANMEGSKCRN